MRGAELLGVNLAELSNSDWQGIRNAYREFGVIFFRDQTLTLEQHMANPVCRLRRAL